MQIHGKITIIGIMTYGDPLSLNQGMMGIAANLPLGRSLSINDQVVSSRKKSVESGIQSILNDTGSSKPQADAIRVDYTSFQGAATLGLDPMVSSASVIHELAYGRINVSTSSRGGNTEYPIPKDSTSHSLDIIV